MDTFERHCPVCKNVTEHVTSHIYHAHKSDGERYAKTLYHSCIVCGTMNREEYYTMLFIVVVDGKAMYFMKELKAKQMAQKHGTDVIEDVVSEKYA